MLVERELCEENVRISEVVDFVNGIQVCGLRWNNSLSSVGLDVAQCCETVTASSLELRLKWQILGSVFSNEGLFPNCYLSF